MRVMHLSIVPRLIAIAVFFGVLATFSPSAIIVLLADGAYPAALFLAALGWGAFPAQRLIGRDAPAEQQMLLALALGLGILSALTLGLGCAAILSAAVAWGLLGIGGLLGVLRLAVIVDGTRTARVAAVAPDSRQLSVAFACDVAGAVPLAVLAAIALFGATLPPGSLWLGEANGYDALEYHLQAPREYFEAGRIAFLPHNVYAQFPQQMEMLYLLLMHLVGDAHDAGIPAQILHALCGFAAVAALAAWTAPGWSRWMVAVVVAGVPWLAYLAGLAYVELGMLFFAAVAAGVMREALQAPNGRSGWLWATAGICAGLAAGCKYTALALVVAPLVIAPIVAGRRGLRERVAAVATFGIAALVAFSPWLVRNAVHTGNPIYPFAFDTFGGAAWSDAQAEQWRRGHQLPASESDPGSRIARVWEETAGSRLFGPVIFLFALISFARAFRSAESWVWAIWFTAGLLAWATFTQMPGRFAVVLLIPLCRGIGAGTTPTQRSSTDAALPRRGAYVGLALVATAIAAAFGIWQTMQQLHRQDQFWQRSAGIALADLVGRPGLFVQSHAVNHDTPPDAHVKLVGDAAVFYVTRRMDYTVVFNRDPWLEFVGGGSRDRAVRSPAEAVGWLANHGVSHVVFSWSEIARLRRTYGFAEFVTPAWAEALQGPGLHRISQARDAAGKPLRDVFEVPHAISPSTQPR